jgi:hypothetical protein
LNKNEIRENIINLNDKYKKGIFYPDLGSGLEMMYNEYFGEWFPRDEVAEREDWIAILFQSIINDKPYRTAA